MILFQCDYNEGAHPEIMKRLMATNMEQTVGYGEDDYCARAAEKSERPAETITLQYIFW